MHKNAAVILLVFTMGLVPGDYWKLLHHHKHPKFLQTEGAVLSGKQITCVSISHLYDFTGPRKLYNIIESIIIQPCSFPEEKHAPHPSFLNILLRAPPVS